VYIVSGQRYLSATTGKEIIIVIVIIIIQKKSFMSPQFFGYRNAEKANKFQKTDSRLKFHVGPIMERFR
jgi:hypothetical protein